MNDFDNKQICSYKDIDRFGFTCDVCGRKVNGCHYINGMKFCAKCYQETFGKDNQQNEIQQLKQQLAEKDIRIEELEGQFAYECECNMQLVELQKQLAEKDKEINSLIVDYEKRISQEQELMSNMEHRLAEKQKTIDEINKEFVQAVHDWKVLCAKKDEEIEMQKNLFELNNEVVINQGKEIFDLRVQVLQQKQNQTQLAIQELEKVNGILTDTIIEVTQNEMDLNKLCYLEEISARFYEKMQEQIKELKGQHND